MIRTSRRACIRTAVLSALLLAGSAPGARAQARAGDFGERFALAADRQAVLAELVPGSEDFYYYSCLAQQHAGNLDAVGPLVEAWIQRHGRTERAIQIEHRQMLLDYGRDPARASAALVRTLGLDFDSQRRSAAEQSALPTRLDPALLDPARLTERALAMHSASVEGLRDAGLLRASTVLLNDSALTNLLQRLKRPDFPDLPALIARQLKSRLGNGVRSLPLIGMLTLEQLDDLAARVPGLLNEEDYVRLYLPRLQPPADVDWRSDLELQRRLLESLEAFVGRLSSRFNSLRAHVLFHRLALDLRLGTPDRARFLAYLRLPRNSDVILPSYAADVVGREPKANLGNEFPTGFGPVRDDRDLVRAYLLRFLERADSYAEFAPYLEERFLRQTFAEAKLTAGLGDLEHWVSLIDSPGFVEALEQRIDIEFAATQRRRFAVEDPVSIDVDVKNVPTLFLRVFEVNTLSWYRETGREIDASIDLDGLIAQHEESFRFDEPPLRRVRRHFDLPMIDHSGVFVVDLIGNGHASRAVIAKGTLQLVQRDGLAGQVVTVLDESGNPVPDATLELASVEYTPDERGEIVVPYTAQPGQKRVLLRHGGRASLASFEHHAERYALQAGVLVDRETLVAGATARLLVRPQLALNDLPCAPALLEDAKLLLTTTDLDGVSSVQVIGELELSYERELVHEFRVPERTRSLSVTLSGRVKSLVRDTHEELTSAPARFELNAIDGTEELHAPLLVQSAAGWSIDLLGKNGESVAHRALEVHLELEEFSDALDVRLQTDENGRVGLGSLSGVTSVRVSEGNTEFGTWVLPRNRCTPVTLLQGAVGDVLRLPWCEPLSRERPLRLLELRANRYALDRSALAAVVTGAVELRGLPAGDFELLFGPGSAPVRVRVCAGTPRGTWIVGRDRALEVERGESLKVRAIEPAGDGFDIQLAGAGPGTRVHAFATRAAAAYSPYACLALPAPIPARDTGIEHPESDFRSSREIGDEVRYILERKLARKFPGSMLPRPGLLLHPWATDDTVFNDGFHIGGGSGGRYGGRASQRKASDDRSPAREERRGSEGDAGTFANLDFLPPGPALLANLKPDARGVVHVARADLGDGSLLHVVAVDAQHSAYATRALPESPRKTVDRRLASAFGPDQHVARTRIVELIRSGQTASVQDAATARVALLDSLTSVYRLFQALSPIDEMRAFEFLLSWPQRSAEEKRALYSAHACHELHVFLHEKDPEFFAAVVAPTLANKVNKTFVDHWLLGDDLSAYLDPWAYERLNTAERILLARAKPDLAEATERGVREAWERLGPDRGREERLFQAALAAQSLAGSGDLGRALDAARKQLGADVAASAGPAGPGTPGPAGPGSPASAGASPVRAEERGLSDSPAESSEPLLDAEIDESTSDLAGLKPGQEQSDAFFLGRGESQQDQRVELERRNRARRLWAPPEATKSYLESDYWHVRQPGPRLIEVNAFWRDFAAARGARPFASPHVAEAAGNFAERMLALAFLDLPFEARPAAIEAHGRGLEWRAPDTALLVREEFLPGEVDESAAPLLVNQVFFRIDDRFVYENGEKREKLISGDFVRGVAYGSHVVVSNPTQTARALDALVQIPSGALPIDGCRATKGHTLALDSFETEEIGCAFYFPTAGSFAAYPVQVAERGRVVAFAAPRVLNVLDAPREVDTESWDVVSQDGSAAEVLSLVDRSNLGRIDLSEVAWRLRERDFWSRLMERLRARQHFDATCWSFGLYHRDARSTAEYLRTREDFLSTCGRALVSPLLTLDPLERGTFEMVEFEPVFNGRAHRFQAATRIPDDDLGAKYRELLGILAEKPALSDVDRLQVTYHLLLADRTEEGLDMLSSVAPERVDAKLQLDYLNVVAGMIRGDMDRARSLAESRRDHPAERWRARFREALAQLDEAQGRSGGIVDPEVVARDAAAHQPALDIAIDAGQIVLTHRNLESAEVSYFGMDLELLFSKSPFEQQDSSAFTRVRPALSERRELSRDGGRTVFEIPERFAGTNLVVEVRAAGMVRRQAWYSNTLDVAVIQSWGQIKVQDRVSQAPLPAVYVKVYAQDRGGKVLFHKDGYTDRRGRFDYASLSTPKGDPPVRFALLIASEDHGSTLRQVDAP